MPGGTKFYDWPRRSLFFAIIFVVTSINVTIPVPVPIPMGDVIPV
jgi:hypothetical protein